MFKKIDFSKYLAHKTNIFKELVDCIFLMLYVYIGLYIRSQQTSKFFFSLITVLLLLSLFTYLFSFALRNLTLDKINIKYSKILSFTTIFVVELINDILLGLLITTFIFCGPFLFMNMGIMLEYVIKNYEAIDNMSILDTSLIVLVMSVNIFILLVHHTRNYHHQYKIAIHKYHLTKVVYDESYYYPNSLNLGYFYRYSSYE